jgi:multidrug efflux pump subunit AcrA (membrane-fusion protein)
MKKLISGLIAAFLLSAGFVAVSAETASAACRPSQYVECPATTTSTAGTPKTVKAGKAAKVKVTVKARGNIKPKGKVTVSVKGPSFKKVLRSNYNGRSLSLNIGKLKKPGKYKVTVAFIGDNTKNSAGRATITVKKKRR